MHCLETIFASADMLLVCLFKNYKTDFILSSFFCRVLLEGGASRNILTDQNERPIDLVDPGDARMLQVMLGPLEKKR